MVEIGHEFLECRVLGPDQKPAAISATGSLLWINPMSVDIGFHLGNLSCEGQILYVGG
jgi:hypothetical protein